MKLPVYPALTEYLDVSAMQHISPERPRQEFPHSHDSFWSRDYLIQLYYFHVIAHPDKSLLQCKGLQDPAIIGVQL